MDSLTREKFSGIPLDAWQRFLSLFREVHSPDDITRELNRLVTEAGQSVAALSPEDVDNIKTHLSEIIKILGAH